MGTVWFLTHTAWIFFIVALFVYLVPLFRPFEVMAPFLLTLALALLLPKMIWTTLFFMLIFFLILGIKDLIFINREGAYQLLITLLWFPVTGIFFANFHSFEYSSAMIAVTLVFFILARNLVRYVLVAQGVGSAGRRETLGAVGISSLLIGELAWALMLLPLLALHQAAILFLAGAILAEFLLAHIRGRLERSAIITNTAIFIGFLGLMFFVTQWGL